MLDVRCPTCLYDFPIDDGNPECGDPPDRPFAREVAPKRLVALRNRMDTGELPSSIGLLPSRRRQPAVDEIAVLVDPVGRVGLDVLLGVLLGGVHPGVLVRDVVERDHHRLE